MGRTARVGTAGLVVAVLGCGGAVESAPATSPPEGPPLVLRLVSLDVPEASPLEAREADLVAEDVEARRASGHGALPPVQATEAGDDGPPRWPVVDVVNATPHGLVVWFAGPCPRTVGLAPEQRYAVEMCAGSYDIAAQLDHPEFLPFVGQGDRVDDGFTYRLTFYVVAEPGAGGRRLRRR